MPPTHLLGYTHPARRRTRALGRAATISRSASSLRLPVVPTYWWDGERNFGDLLTVPMLLEVGVAPVHRRARFAAVVGVGSLLEHIPADYSGVVWGSGSLLGRGLSFPRARFAGVRGRLTKDVLGLSDDTVLGDPGLLYAASVAPRAKRWRVGVVAHYTHQEDKDVARIMRWGDDVHFINVRRSPRAVAAEISACHSIVSSSLHGLIFADGLGVPATWVTLGKPLAGGVFKFHDHESVVLSAGTRRARIDDLSDIPAVEQAARLAHRELTDVAVEGLRKSREDLAATLQSFRRPLVRVWMPGRERQSFGSPGSSFPSASNRTPPTDPASTDQS